MSDINVLIDIGNTRVKVGAEESGKVSYIFSSSYDPKDPQPFLDQFSSYLDLHQLKNIYLSSVASKKTNDHFVRNICKLTEITPQVAVTNRKMCGLENAYSKPEILGIDRWLALIGAFNLFDAPMCVVDCGTAVTIDTINDKGFFIGGLIVPGLAIMRNALIKNADAIDEYGEIAEKNYFPKDTSSAVNAGTVLSITALVEKVLHHYEATEYQKPLCVVTGGDGKIIQSYMDVESIYHPNLVFHGLAKYFRLI